MPLLLPGLRRLESVEQRLRLSFLLLLLNCAYFNTFYNAQSYYKQALRVRESNPSGAKDLFGKAQKKAMVMIQRYPNSRWTDDAFFLIAMCSYYKGEYKDAVRYYEDFISTFPNSKDVKKAEFYKALSLRALKDYASALAELSTLREDKRWRERALFEIGQTYFEAEDYSEASKNFEEFLKKFPKSKKRQDVILKLAQAYFLQQKWDKARDYYKEYISHAYTSYEKAEAKLKLSQCFMKLNRPELAEAELKGIEGEYPRLKPDIDLWLGKAILRQGREDEAIPVLRRATGEPGAEAYFLIGKLYEKREEIEKAIAYYDSAKMKDPSSDYAAMALKRSSFLQEFMRPDTTEEKDPARVQFLLAERYLLDLNQPEQALKEYEKVYTLYPDSPYAPKALYAQAYILKEVLKREGYRDLYRILIERYPESYQAKQARKVYESKNSKEGDS